MTDTEPTGLWLSAAGGGPVGGAGGGMIDTEPTGLWLGAAGGDPSAELEAA